MLENLCPNETIVNNACAWSMVKGPSSRMLVMVYSDKEDGRPKVTCFSSAGMQNMPAEEYGFDHSLLTDIDRITDAELVKRLKVSPVSRESQWHTGAWSETMAENVGAKFRKKASNASSN